MFFNKILIIIFFPYIAYGSECDMPAVAGFGDERLVKFYFNAAEEACESFTYSGQGGNKNNFDSKQMCERKCQQGKYKMSQSNINKKGNWQFLVFSDQILPTFDVSLAKKWL